MSEGQVGEAEVVDTQTRVAGRVDQHRGHN